MAIFNEILSGRFNRSLQKIFGIKGPPPVRQLGGEVMPVHMLGTGVESRYLEGWNRFAAAQSDAALAANTDAVRLRNPSGSNVIAVIEKILVDSNTSQLFTLSLGPAAVALAGGAQVLTNARLDARTNINPTLEISGANNSPAGISSQKLVFLVVANASIDLIFFEDQEITLLPGDGVQLTTSVVNTTLDVSFIWRERLLEESERT
jgi:hypothetical protein